VADRRQDVLRLQPHMIPALRAEFRSAVDEISSAMTNLKRNAYLAAPWLGDEVSSEVATYYATRALDGPASSYQSLLAYRDELIRVHDTLQQMEDDYRRTEGDNAARWGQKA
jgi:uncharacterized protein YukE